MEYFCALIDVTRHEVVFFDVEGLAHKDGSEVFTDKADAARRAYMLGLQAELNARDIGGEWEVYGPSDRPFAFLPATGEEVSAAMSAADDSGVSAID